MNKELEFENSIKNILNYIGEDIQREGLLDTPKRVRKAFEFMCSGYKESPKEIIQKALFTSTNDEMVVVKDMSSTHFVNIICCQLLEKFMLLIFQMERLLA